MRALPVSAPGMGSFMHVPELLNRIVRVHLRGRQARMAQQVLYRVQLRTVVH